MSDVREYIDSQVAQERDKEDELRRAKEAIAGPVPLIAESPDCSVDLPRGLFHRGIYKRQVLVRELTGADEEALAKVREQADFFDLVIALGVVSVDDFDLSSLPVAERQGWLRQLLIGERDILFMSVIKATFGDTKTMVFTCQTCKKEQEIDLLLGSDFPVKVPEDVDATLFTYTTSKGQELQYRLATGDDQLEAVARSGSSLAEQNTIILSRVITKLDGGLVTDPIHYARSLSMRDRQGILSDLISKQPSIDLTVTTKCANCGADQTLLLGWLELFRS